MRNTASSLRFLAVLLLLLATSCGSGEPDLESGAVDNDRTAADPLEDFSSAFGELVDKCVDPVEDPGTLWGVVDVVDTWVEIEADDLSVLAESETTDTKDLASKPIAGASVAIHDHLVLPDEFRALTATTLPFDSYILGLSSPLVPEQPSIGAPLIGVTDVGDVFFLGDCQNDLTLGLSNFQTSQEDAIASTPREFLGLLLTSADLAEKLRSITFNSPSPTAWEDVDPDIRTLDETSTPGSVFDDLYRIKLEFELPEWWRESKLGICPRIERAWTGFCLGAVETRSGETIAIDSWVAEDGLLELHLIDADGDGTSSLGLLAALDISELRKKPILVSLADDVSSAAALLEASTKEPREWVSVESLDGVVSPTAGLGKQAEEIDAGAISDG